MRSRPPPPRPPKQQPLELSATVRARFELIDGQARAGFNSSDDLFSFRSILTADYHITPDVQVVAELWDSRAYNGNRGSPISTGEVNTLEPAQANLGVTLQGALGKGSEGDLQAGRFLLALGSRRLVAADDHRNTTTSSTGVRDPAGRSGSFAGHQLDARLRFNLTPKIQLERDVVLLAKGRFLREAPNAPPGSWTKYISLNTLFLS